MIPRAERAWSVRTVAAAVALAAACALAQKKPPPIYTPVGGANSPAPSPPPRLVIETDILEAGTFAVRVPTGTYVAAKGGAANYTVPGPIAAFKGADGAWRGHGYLETGPRLARFEGKLTKASAELSYTFQGGRSYRVKLRVASGAVLLDEASTLGPRNLYVFDCYYGGWLPAAGFAVDRGAAHHAFLYLPCYYDKPEVTVNPAAASAKAGQTSAAGKAEHRHGAVEILHGSSPAAATRPEEHPAAVAVLSAEPAKKDMAGFFCRQIDQWENADRMGFQLWQRRQLPGDPASRHFLGPETKSDSTPNPRTAGMLGKSLYEGHVTIELRLGVGTRKLGFAVAAKPDRKSEIPEAFKKIVRANP